MKQYGSLYTNFGMDTGYTSLLKSDWRNANNYFQEADKKKSATHL